MKISETTFPFLEGDCVQRFGMEKGNAIFRQTEAVYEELLAHADDKHNTVIRNHLQRKLFPPMAYYKTLCANGFSKEKALEYVKQETCKAASAKRDKMKKMAGLPFAYGLYRMGVKSFMRKNFPDDGWQTEWVRCDGKEIHFNLHRCIYWDLTNQHGCPELCCVYCENDAISFSGLLPKIRFERGGTLGNGAPFCDFHFVKV